MPVQTQLQQRRGTAASWTSTNPTLAAGEIGFESDTGKFKIGNGSTAWASLAYATNGAVVSPLTTKGDLFTYSTTNARLPVGANGEQIVADSSTSTGLRYQGNYAAGKNAVINGDFGVWQRGTSFTNPGTSFSYGADRWQNGANAATTTQTVTRQTFTPGAAPVAGYEGQYFFRSTLTNIGSATVIALYNKIENVQTYAGQTVTLSFWAKADSARSLAYSLEQNFGSGGSSTVPVSSGSVSLTTSWARFSLTVNVPSISGKTIGSNSYFGITFNQAVVNGSVFDLWGVQLEAGSVATAFQTATGTLQGELAACQRYYFRYTNLGAYEDFGFGNARSASAADLIVKAPTTMRTNPTSMDYSNLFVLLSFAASPISVTTASLASGRASANCPIVYLETASGITQNQGYYLTAGTGTSYIGFSAEL
jgi:hypothetical protein